MSPCPRCGTERTPSGYCGAQGQHAMCALRAELRDVKAERDRLRTAIRINADETRDLRAAVLAIAAEMTHEDRHVRHGAWAVRLREAVGE